MNPFRRSFLLIALILLLPSLIFSLYELGTLRQNEEVIEDIYHNQLDAILFSINQYSEDMASSWANRVEACYGATGKIQSEKLQKLFSESAGIEEVYQYNHEKKSLTPLSDKKEMPDLENKIQNLLEKKDSTLTLLAEFLGSNYRKIESVALNESEYQILLFARKTSSHVEYILISHKPSRFIREVLDPKIQEISRDKFIIAAFHETTDSLIYEAGNTSLSETQIKHRRPFWLLHNYSMGIELQDRTISELARERSQRNLIMVGLLDLVLLIGIWFIFRSVKKQLELSQLKTDFVSNVSHEIRTPLALINMYIETLEMGRVKSKEKIKEYYQVIQQETQRLSGIVNKILNFSQLESGKRKFSFHESDLNEISQKALASFEISLNKQDFEKQIKLEPDIPKVLLDPEAITDVLVNLIDNAIKYSDKTKYIAISTGFTKDEKVFCEISDKGIGISENEQKHIFDKFYRVTEKNLALKAKGSGLGLSIVKHIMDIHKGSIIINSKKGDGSTFRLIFPK